MNSLKKWVDQQKSAPLWPVGGGGGVCASAPVAPPAHLLKISTYEFFFFNASTLYCKHYKVLLNKTLNKYLNKLHYFTQKSHGDYIIKTYSKHSRGFHRE